MSCQYCRKRGCRGECTQTQTLTPTCVDTFPEPCQPPPRHHKPKCPQPKCPPPQCDPCQQPSNWRPWCPPSNSCPPQPGRCVNYCCDCCGNNGSVEVPRECPVYVTAFRSTTQSALANVN